MTVPVLDEPVVQIDGARFRWHDAPTDCLHIDHLSVGPGERVFMHGPSGAGKSTLLSILAGVMVVQHGCVTLAGREWRKMAGPQRDRHRADRVGYIFQQFNLLPFMSVFDNVTLPCRLSRRRYQGSQPSGGPEAEASQLLERLELEPALWNRKACRLSVGQQQRVAAARALIGQPQLVIADEPTSALDSEMRDTFVHLLLEAGRRAGAAVVVVSHDRGIEQRFDRSLSLPSINAARRPNVARLVSA